MLNTPNKMNSSEAVRELSDFFLGKDYYDLLYTYGIDHPVDMDKFTAIIVERIKKKVYKTYIKIMAASVLVALLLIFIIFELMI